MEVAARSVPMPMARTLMITVAWGNFLALVLPGIVALLALRGEESSISSLVGSPGALTPAGGLYLLLLATLAGVILDGVRRITFDLWFPKLRRYLGDVRSGAVPNVYSYVTPENLDVFRDAVENSYKYATFYGNLCWALALMVGVHALHRTWSLSDAGYLVLAVAMARAAYVQSGFFLVRMDGFVEVEKLRREKESADVPR